MLRRVVRLVQMPCFCPFLSTKRKLEWTARSSPPGDTKCLLKFRHSNRLPADESTTLEPARGLDPASRVAREVIRSMRPFLDGQKEMSAQHPGCSAAAGVLHA